jgi:hypothetical protein
VRQTSLYLFFSARFTSLTFGDQPQPPLTIGFPPPPPSSTRTTALCVQIHLFIFLSCTALKFFFFVSSSCVLLLSLKRVPFSVSNFYYLFIFSGLIPAIVVRASANTRLSLCARR